MRRLGIYKLLITWQKITTKILLLLNSVNHHWRALGVWDSVFHIEIVYLVLGCCFWYWDGVFGTVMVYFVLGWCIWNCDGLFGIGLVYFVLGWCIWY